MISFLIQITRRPWGRGYSARLELDGMPAGFTYFTADFVGGQKGLKGDQLLKDVYRFRSRFKYAFFLLDQARLIEKRQGELPPVFRGRLKD
jgi:hypothetical protein